MIFWGGWVLAERRLVVCLRIRLSSSVCQSGWHYFLISAALTCARLDYAFLAATAGTYYVWVRALGPNTSSDSVHMGLNGTATTSSVQLGNFYPTGSLVWSSTRNDVTDRITVQITTPGKQTLNLWMRESGAIIDRILLTPDSTYTPSGTGPAESAWN